MLENLKLAILRHKQRTGESQGQIGIQANIVETRLTMIIYERAEATKKERKALAKVLCENEEKLFLKPEQAVTV